MHPLLLEGLTDAIGFVAGVLVAYGLALVLGLDPMGQGYGARTIAGILMAGLGGGIGLHLAKRWRQNRRKTAE